MRVPMPDGTVVFFLPIDGGVCVGTQGKRRDDDGKMPIPMSVNWVSDYGHLVGTFIELLDKSGVVPAEDELIID